MQLTLNGIQKKEDWKAANIALPTYDIEKIRKNTKENQRLKSRRYSFYSLSRKVFM